MCQLVLSLLHSTRHLPEIWLALSCPIGAFSTIHCNEICDLTANLMSEVCHDMCGATHSTPIQWLSLSLSTAWRNDAALLNIMACMGFGVCNNRVHFSKYMYGFLTPMHPPMGTFNYFYVRDVMNKRSEMLMNSMFLTLNMALWPHTFSTPLEGWEAMWTNLVIPYSLCLPSATSIITVMYILYMKNTTTSCMHYGRQTKSWMSDKDCLGL